MTRLLWLVLSLVASPLCTTGAEVSGFLRDNQGNGLVGISVEANVFSISNGFTQPVTTTDASGHFRLVDNAGWWTVSVPASELNGRGYFSVADANLTVTDQSELRFTTRKLDFTHRITGRIIDQAGQPLAGYSLYANISENNAQFETNAVMNANGEFVIAAVPAIWSLKVDRSHFFNEKLVEVQLTNLETNVTFVAPAATSIMFITATNLGRVDVVASTEAFGETYHLVGSLLSPGVLNFLAFDGIWTVSATNHDYGGQSSASLSPVSVTVTNGSGSLLLSGPVFGITQQVQRVRTLTTSGEVVSNASVYAFQAGRLFGISPPPQFNGTPGVFDLQVAPGRWTLTATIQGVPDSISWYVSREVTIVSNIAPPDVTLVFPDPLIGPRIFGTVRTPAGAGVPSIPVYLYVADPGTNYSVWGLITDPSGHFDIHVLPGRWRIEIPSGYCPQPSFVVVSNQDTQVDFDRMLPISGAPVNVNVSTLCEDGSPVPEPWISMYSVLDYRQTNASSNFEWLLRPGIWHASSFFSPADTYMLSPSSFTWQLSPVAATNLIFVVRRTSARIEGRLRDDQGRLLLSGYAAAWTRVNGTNFLSHGAIASGYFSLNVFPGEWQVGVSVSSYPTVGAVENVIIPSGRDPNTAEPTTYFTTPPLRWIRVSNDLVRCEFVTTNLPIPASVTLAVSVLREDGSGVHGLTVIAYSATVYQTTASTDNNGLALLSVAPGPLMIDTLGYDNPADELLADRSLLWPTLSRDITAPSNHVALLLREPSSYVCGTVSNASSMGVQPVTASAELSGTNYNTSACWDIDGHYCLPVLTGLWTVQIWDVFLNDFGLQGLPRRDVNVPITGHVPPVDFVLSPLVGDFREAHLKKPLLLPNGALQLELNGQAALSWRVERSSNLIDWTPIASKYSAHGSIIIEDPTSASNSPTFYRAVWIN